MFRVIVVTWPSEVSDEGERIADFLLNGGVDFVHVRKPGSDDVSCGVCFVTDSCVVSDMLPVQKNELKMKRSLYCRMMNSGNERTMASPQAKYALSKKLCADLLHSAPDLYGQHLAILQITNEGDSSCVSTLIPFTAPDKNSLLRQDASGQGRENHFERVQECGQGHGKASSFNEDRCFDYPAQAEFQYRD